MGTAISCIECSQVADLILKGGRESSKAPSLHAAVLSFEDCTYQSLYTHTCAHFLLSLMNTKWKSRSFCVLAVYVIGSLVPRLQSSFSSLAV